MSDGGKITLKPRISPSSTFLHCYYADLREKELEGEKAKDKEDYSTRFGFYSLLCDGAIHVHFVDGSVLSKRGKKVDFKDPSGNISSTSSKVETADPELSKRLKLLGFFSRYLSEKVATGQPSSASAETCQKSGAGYRSVCCLEEGRCLCQHSIARTCPDRESPLWYKVSPLAIKGETIPDHPLRLQS